MNQDLADLLAAVLYEKPHANEELRILIDDIASLGLDEVPRYKPLVAAMKAAVSANAAQPVR